jgi:hypothetical protein
MENITKNKLNQKYCNTCDTESLSEPACSFGSCKVLQERQTVAVAKHGIILSHVFNIKYLKLNKSVYKSETEILLQTPTLMLWNLPSQQGGY